MYDQDLADMSKTHCVWRHRSATNWLRWWLVAWRTQTITWTSVDLLLNINSTTFIRGHWVQVCLQYTCITRNFVNWKNTLVVTRDKYSRQVGPGTTHLMIRAKWSLVDHAPLISLRSPSISTATIPTEYLPQLPFWRRFITISSLLPNVFKQIVICK